MSVKIPNKRPCFVPRADRGDVNTHMRELSLNRTNCGVGSRCPGVPDLVRSGVVPLSSVDPMHTFSPSVPFIVAHDASDP